MGVINICSCIVPIVIVIVIIVNVILNIIINIVEARQLKPCLIP